MTESKPLKCPRCNAWLRKIEPDLYNIEWNEFEKSFKVKLIYKCVYCREQFDEKIISIPMEIAEQSTCSCGHTLHLADFKIQKKKNDIEFEGYFICPECNTRLRKIYVGIIKGLKNFWNKTKKVTINSKGITYEKDS
jgi:uncharacterized protein with PIN domain